MKGGMMAKYIGTQQPCCGLHEHFQGRRDVPALYDACIKGRTTWTYMCSPCFHIYGVGLGTGKGQQLLFSERTEMLPVPADVTPV